MPIAKPWPVVRRACACWSAALLLLGAGAPAARADSSEQVAPAGAAQQILVMVRLPPPHYRPDGSYGGGWKGGAGEAARSRTAEALAAAGHLRILEAWPMPDIGVECFVMALSPESAAPDQVVRLLAADPRVESVQAMQDFHTLAHNDPLFPAQPAASRWHLAELHTASTGRGVRIAVIDSEVDDHHPDLAGQIEANRNVVDAAIAAPESHGTAVAGIISARADDGLGIAGVAPGARLIALRACWELKDDGGKAQCNSFTLAKALEAALDFNVDVINMSLSGPDDRLLGRLIDVAIRRGVTVVGASAVAGEGQEFPASHPGVLAVGCDADAPRAGVLRAPGQDVPATLPGRRWGLVSGSSFATAHVSGLVALLRELDRQHGDGRQRAGRELASLAPSALPAPIDACALIAQSARSCICECGASAQTTH